MLGTLDNDIVDIRTQAHGLIGRQRPGGGGPDDDRDRSFSGAGADLLSSGPEGFLAQDLEADVDGRGGLVLVFDFGLSEG